MLGAALTSSDWRTHAITGLDFVNDDNTSSFLNNMEASVRIVVSATSSLSVIGAILVILSYVCVASLRSQARAILVNLSLMDLGVGCANLVGSAVDFNRFYYNYTARVDLDPTRYQRWSCQVQATVAMFCSNASVMWTVGLAVYMYLLVFRNWNENVRVFMPITYALSYILPLGLCAWLWSTGRLGYAPYDSSGWCTLRTMDPHTRKLDLFASVMAFDLWVYMALILLPTIYLAIFLRLKFGFQLASSFIGERNYWKRALEFLDFKLILIPMVFLFLRIWTCISGFLLMYLHLSPNKLPSALVWALIYLSGIGDSGQGFANGLLFVVFTDEVRSKLFPFEKCCQSTRNFIPSRIGRIPISINEKTPLVRGSGTRVNPLLKSSERLTPSLSSSGAYEGFSTKAASYS